MLSDRQKIGVGLTAFGTLFFFLGVMFFFDSGLLAMGNVLFLSGVSLTIGPMRAGRFFIRPKNAKGSAAFVGGLLLVIVLRWCIVGMLLEAYGFVMLFADFFPTVLMFLKNVPVIGPMLNSPRVKAALNKIAPVQTLPV